ncbi:MAG: UDP-N-acetylmuramate--L-alanine ligase [Candidatus Cloacimonetes bacterium]|nr:UDP-N-acetylmuramate--L-alanine ligase [Candidatus Cloacimonadota bacterium]
MLRKTKKIHFVGIGGIGMSGIAEFLHNQGYEISGSDLQSTELTNHLSNEGIKIFEGHRIENLENIDVLVKSSAVKDDNPEVIHALHTKIPVIRRAEMLAELMRMSFGIGIAGTHGKTTSTSMVGMILSAANLEPTVIVGGRVMNYGKNNLLGSGEYIVVEADEYDRSFLTLSPIIAAITNIEADHLDCYESLNDIKDAFVTYANKVPFFGSVVCCLDDIGVQSILPEIKKNIVTYGITRQADVRAINIENRDFKSKFEILYKDYNLGSIKINTIGKHNIQNALLAVSIGIEMNISFDKIKKGLEEFKGVYRRFEFIGEINKIKIFDDYAHHPTEIMATLQGVRENTENRVIAVFQPHLYSRTRDFYAEFGRSFYNADILVVTPIYPAREEEIEGISGQLIVDTAIQSGHNKAIYIENNELIIDTLIEIMNENDIIVTLGAGDIHKFGKKLYDLSSSEDFQIKTNASKATING